MSAMNHASPINPQINYKLETIINLPCLDPKFNSPRENSELPHVSE